MNPFRLPGRTSRPGVTRRAWTLISAFCLLASARASAQSAATVIYAEGDSMTVAASSGRLTVVDVPDAVGYELHLGDTVATEHDTFVEIQLLPSESVVKIAENTNFTIERRDTPRGGTFQLVYGKVRARVAVLTNQDVFVIRSSSAIAGVRGTDFGVSVVIPGRETAEVPQAAELEETPAVTQVYCFEGAVEVASTPSVSSPEAPPPPTVTVRENEVVTLTAASAEPPVVEVMPEEIRSYWETNDFRAEPIETPESAEQEEPRPQAEAQPSAQPRAQPEAQPSVEEQKPAQVTEPAPELVTPKEVLIQRAQVNRFRFRAVSVLLFVVGAAFETAGLVDALVPGTDIFGDNGVGMIGVGGVFLAGGVFSTFQAARFGRTIQDLSEDQGP